MKLIRINKGNVAVKVTESGAKLGDACNFIPTEETFRFSVPLEAVAVESEELPEGHEWVELRRSASMLAPDEYAAAAKASELLFWNRSVCYCQGCGAKLHRATEISKKCDSCGKEYWPQMSPAVIVLVKRGDEALLVHARTFSRPFFGLVAGFVETGESLEECVRREVREETSLEIKNIRYIASQSWPFPSQLMIGFTAEYASGEVRFADGELTEGGFFSRDSLPLLPSPPSIARSLVDAWVAGVL